MARRRGCVGTDECCRAGTDNEQHRMHTLYVWTFTANESIAASPLGISLGEGEFAMIRPGTTGETILSCGWSSFQLKDTTTMWAKMSSQRPNERTTLSRYGRSGTTAVERHRPVARLPTRLFQEYIHRNLP